MTLDYEMPYRHAWLAGLQQEPQDRHWTAILMAVIFAALVVVGASDYTDAIRTSATCGRSP